MSGREHLPSLLLLPNPPDSLEWAKVLAAYKPSLQSTLAKVKNEAYPSTLIIGLTCPVLSGDVSSQALSWPYAQSLLAMIYSIACAACVNLNIATDAGGRPGSVDVRAVLIDYSPDRNFDNFEPDICTGNSVIMSLGCFASACHPWQYIFHVQSEPGLALQKTFLRFSEKVQTILHEQLVPVDGGLTMHSDGTATPTMRIETPTHGIVCLGGTFDHLHPGHRLLLTAATFLLRIPESGAATPCQLIIGVTADELLKNKKHVELIQSWDERARSVLSFLWSTTELSRQGWERKQAPKIEEKEDGALELWLRNSTILVQCVKIHDAFGPTITNRDVEALVVSAETRAGGKAVNDKRAEQGWSLLEIFEIDVLDGGDALESPAMQRSDFSSKISSSAIREAQARETVV